ncbi:MULTISPECIES: hypothetical protein [Burkholderia]|uniref:hypothetical protein n=1 Tax=Burkholderia TaxID=32008 RepID=UPI0015C5D48F|nr:MULTISPECIES: hypothetical protein [Burkholderia]EKS9800106.1 hypothetical protein [Burkholderia cepacia]EKS9806863.1 hypothetical protein [Burkholderia cepacia]EKS9815196.1 hypothetical protein [Burkholderia cepacia]EKS9817813.1 hypothetical protein [Burkholderia cepacia]EKS9830348.1 hypothetical protein [Burkholderia cepacia]
MRIYDRYSISNGGLNGRRLVEKRQCGDEKRVELPGRRPRLMPDDEIEVKRLMASVSA